METNFGGFIKARRIAKRITLRAFSEAVGIDPSNYSRMERGHSQPPTPEKLATFARLLNIPLDSQEYREMVRLAALGRGEIPPAILSDEAVLAKLPVLFRTLEGDKVDGAVLDELFEMIRIKIDDSRNSSNDRSTRATDCDICMVHTFRPACAE